MNEDFELREATEEDIMQIFVWANDISTRINAFNKATIQYEDHEKWFYKRLNNRLLFRIFILQYKNVAIGQIRFEKVNDSAIIDYYISKAYRGKGLGNKIVTLGIKKIIEEWKELKFIISEVKKENVLSNKIFERLSFSKEEKKDKFIYNLKICN